MGKSADHTSSSSWRVAVPPTRQPQQPSRFSAIIVVFEPLSTSKMYYMSPFNIMIIPMVYYGLNIARIKTLTLLHFKLLACLQLRWGLFII